jgi:hypothetical protein
MSFLTGPDLMDEAGDPVRARLHQAQRTLLVTGHDNWSWDVFCFVNTFFEHEGIKKKDREEFIDQAKGLNGDGPDFVQIGGRTLDMSPSRPREYFLQTLSNWLQDGLERTWSEIADQLEDHVEGWVSLLCFSASCRVARAHLCSGVILGTNISVDLQGGR